MPDGGKCSGVIDQEKNCYKVNSAGSYPERCANPRCTYGGIVSNEPCTEGVRRYVLDLSGAGPWNPPKLCKEVVGCVQKGKTTPCLSSDEDCVRADDQSKYCFECTDERYRIPCYDRKSSFCKKTSTTEQCEKIVNECHLKGTNKACNNATPECVRNDNDSEPCQPICVNKNDGKTCSTSSPDCVKVGTGEPCKVFCALKSTKSTCPDIFWSRLCDE